MSVMDWSGSRLCLVEIYPSNSMRDLVDLVRNLQESMDAMDALDQEYEPPRLVVQGFNDDPRNLWEIPRAVELLRRAYSAGFVAVLEPSTTTGPRADGAAFGLGALEVWLIATGRFDVDCGRLEIETMALLDFVSEVMPAEVIRVERMVANMRSKGGEA
jgi:hypothetical protein